MRILIAHHFPLDRSAAALQVRQLLTDLLRTGHQARLLLVAPPGFPAETLPTTEIKCGAADGTDLRMPLPRFAAHDKSASSTFAELSTDQLADYREGLRQTLDREVDTFNPHLIHVQHVWLWAHLALESGVPYVASAWPEELAASRATPRLGELAQQAADNASRILTVDQSLAARVQSTFEVAPERLVVLPEGPALTAHCVELYRAVWTERFGALPEE